MLRPLHMVRLGGLTSHGQNQSPGCRQEHPSSASRLQGRQTTVNPSSRSWWKGGRRTARQKVELALFCRFIRPDLASVMAMPCTSLTAAHAVLSDGLLHCRLLQRCNRLTAAPNEEDRVWCGSADRCQFPVVSNKFLLDTDSLRLAPPLVWRHRGRDAVLEI